MVHLLSESTNTFELAACRRKRIARLGHGFGGRNHQPLRVADPEFKHPADVLIFFLHRRLLLCRRRLARDQNEQNHENILILPHCFLLGMPAWLASSRPRHRIPNSLRINAFTPSFPRSFNQSGPLFPCSSISKSKNGQHFRPAETHSASSASEIVPS